MLLDDAGAGAGAARRPCHAAAILHLVSRLHSVPPLTSERWDSLPDVASNLACRARLGCHIGQRLARMLGTALLRTAVPHPLGWPLPQELVVMLMYSILQSRQVHAWRGFFSGAGEVQAWVGLDTRRVPTGACESVWCRLPAGRRPAAPRARLTWLFAHGGAFVAGDALMYQGAYACWLSRLADAGIDCSILSVDYPLAPEHPFPAAVEALAGVVEWLAAGGGGEEAAGRELIMGGDSAGGNLTLAALALLRERGRLATPPLVLTLLSPAVDLSDGSVFGRGEPVSAHIDTDEPDSSGSCSDEGSGGERGQGSSSSCSGSSECLEHDCESEGSCTVELAAAAADVCGGAAGDRDQQDRQHAAPAEVKQRKNCAAAYKQHQHRQHHQQQQHHHHHHQHQQHPDEVGGGAGAWQLLCGLASEAAAAWAVHRDGAAAASAACRGWFDYLPGPSMADDLHHYLHDPALLTHPLVSPTHLPDFRGLCRRGMLVTAGGAELMRPDIAAFASKVAGAGVPVTYHAEPGEPHSYGVLAMPHLVAKGADVLVGYVVGALLREQQEQQG